MALGRHDQRHVASVARTPLDLVEQSWRRRGAVGDNEKRRVAASDMAP
jgi:hypothetical protein